MDAGQQDYLDTLSEVDGKYNLLGRIGGGGTSVVFEAEHKFLKRRVAIKLLRQRMLEQPTILQRFRMEAQALASLQHPNIVKVQDYGVVKGGIPYLVMEKLEGNTLASRLNHLVPLPIDLAVEYTARILEALTTAHGLGLIHRDLKPGNIFLHADAGQHETLKILDFGMAKLIAETRLAQGIDARPQTAQGVIMGTPGYIAPEIIIGRRDYDHRVDLFAVGALLYVMLTGQRLVQGESPTDVLQATISGPVVPPSQLRKEIGRVLEGVVLKAAAGQADERFSSASEMLAALRDAANQQGEGDPEVAPTRRISNPPSKKVSEAPQSAMKFDIGKPNNSSANPPSADGWLKLPEDKPQRRDKVESPAAQPEKKEISSGFDAVAVLPYRPVSVPPPDRNSSFRFSQAPQGRLRWLFLLNDARASIHLIIIVACGLLVSGMLLFLLLH